MATKNMIDFQTCVDLRIKIRCEGARSQQTNTRSIRRSTAKKDALDPLFFDYNALMLLSSYILYGNYQYQFSNRVE